MIPEAAVEAAAKAMYAQDGGVSEFALWVYQDYAKAMLEAAAPHMLVHEREEIGYLCGRGHFVFHDEPDSGECSSKRTAGVYVERDTEVEFYGPYEMADDNGFVYASGCGYSEEDYAEELSEARQSLIRKIEEWRNS